MSQVVVVVVVVVVGYSMYILPSFYIYPSQTAIPHLAISKVITIPIKFLKFKSNFPFGSFPSSNAVPSVQVVFQYSSILVFYSSNTMPYIPVFYSSKPASNILVIVPVAFQSSGILFQY